LGLQIEGLGSRVVPDKVETHGQRGEKFLQVQVVHEQHGGDDEDKLPHSYDEPPKPVPGVCARRGNEGRL
jgi:hypothetical protein